jgi:hypothetical protein
MTLIGGPLHHNWATGSWNLDADGATLIGRLRGIPARRWQTNWYKGWGLASIVLLRLSDPTPKLVGIKVVIQGNTGNRRSRSLALGYQASFKFRSVPAAFSVRAGYAYVVHR